MYNLCSCTCIDYMYIVHVSITCTFGFFHAVSITAIPKVGKKRKMLLFLHTCTVDTVNMIEISELECVHK